MSSASSDYYFHIKPRLQKVEKKINKYKIDKTCIDNIITTEKEIKNRWEKTNIILHDIYNNINKIHLNKKIETSLDK